MKKTTIILFIITALMLSAVGCSKADTKQTQVSTSAAATESTSAAATESTSAAPVKEGLLTGDMPTVLNTTEYTLYQNIFYNDQKASFDGKETEKEGTFTTLTDAYNNVTRYYVWGYNDNTKCCDWQWELKIDDTAKLPTNGSLIKVKGTYAVDEAALDGLWITSPVITVEKEFSGHDGDIDMLSMSNTLERVQLTNVVQKKESFEGKTICGYGRMKSDASIEDPYYDNSWSVDVITSDKIPAFGTLIQFTGTVKDGVIADCTLSDNTQY